MMELLRLEHVRKHYGPHHVLSGIDLAVAEHDVTCLIGASGSGKSTLLRCINLLETVDDGTIWLAGRDITDPRVDADDVRREIGLVFQAYNLFPHRSVIDNVTLGPRRLLKMRRAAAEARARELLDRFGLAAKATAYPDSLSGGQQQRVAVVRAIAMSPTLLLLDEITSALDPLLVAEVLDVIAELKGDGMTIVMATHEMDFAQQVADRVVFLDEGKVVEDGTASEVFRAPRDERTARFLARHVQR
ncbi:MAG: amino acid ABC transporter ATP-binding protein [Propionibacteriales bacterium]|nr:amino acid ABC transporter ATP-binding protein [Propionibacteriales bacterium]